MSALMAAHGITYDELTQAAAIKAQERGRFKSGAWLAL
jgi:hypothetical protein